MHASAAGVVRTKTIQVDDRQVARIAGSRIKVMHLVMEVQANGYMPQQLHEQFPHLKLAQIYAALTYYHDHKEQVDRQINEATQLVEQLRAQAEETPFHKRLREAGRIK